MAKKEATVPQADTTAMTEAPKPSQSEWFTHLVMREYGANVGSVEMTDYQRVLVQGYFIGVDRALQNAEEARQRKNDNDLPVVWKNVNHRDLVLDVVHYSRMGLDMMQANHINAIPFKNNKTSKYDITFIPGYSGIQYIAEKYALCKPVAITAELVYKNDVFLPIKKSVHQPVESYEFDIANPFDRGEVVGGFGYIEYEDATKNKLIIMSRKDMEKRKPKYAAAEFWGKWEEEMLLKTLKRTVYGTKHIPLDPKKVDQDWHYMKMREAEMADITTQAEIEERSNATLIDLTAGSDTLSADPPPLPAEDQAKPDAPPSEPPAPVSSTKGPDF